MTETRQWRVTNAITRRSREQKDVARRPLQDTEHSYLNQPAARRGSVQRGSVGARLCVLYSNPPGE
jgi:hypothetical protein